jgi:hypothetical protein
MHLSAMLVGSAVTIAVLSYLFKDNVTNIYLAGVASFSGVAVSYFMSLFINSRRRKNSSS